MPVVIFTSYWWLIFPIMGFGFAGFSMWMHHRRSQRALDILKSYADQGKDVPHELMKALGGGADGYNGAPGYGSAGSGPYGPGPGPGPYGPWGWGGWGGWRAYRWGPYWAWRRVFIFGALTAGFSYAAQYGDWDGDSRGFVVVAIIMGVLFVGSLLTALMSTMWRPK